MKRLAALLLVGACAALPSNVVAPATETAGEFWYIQFAPDEWAEATKAREEETVVSLVPINRFVRQAVYTKLSAMEAPDDRSRAEHGFRSVLSRSPDASELDRVMAYYRQELDYFRERPDAAAKLVWDERADRGSAGPAAGNAPTIAAWTMLASVLLNLDEAITRP